MFLADNVLNQTEEIESQHLTFRNRYLWLWIQVAIWVAFTQPSHINLQWILNASKCVSVSPVSLRKFTCAFPSTPVFENAVPLLYENDNAELCFELFIWRQWKVTDPVTLFFPVPLIKGSMHPWDRWLGMEFINWMLPCVRHMPGSQEIWRDWVWILPLRS